MFESWRNGKIEAKDIKIGRKVMFGNNIDIKVNGTLEIGDYSNLGDDISIRGNNIKIGKHFYHSKGMEIGGGGWNGPDANLIIGDRCTMHKGFINVASSVEIGNDVGFSHNVSLLTHGFWQSVFEGYPTEFGTIKIGNGVILGYNTTVMPWVSIGDNCVVGASSNVTKSIGPGGIYVGNPAKKVKDIEEMSLFAKHEMLSTIIEEYKRICKFHNIHSTIVYGYPYVVVNDFTINVETFQYEGKETKETDHFRDFIRKYGIRIYTERPFG